jgi:transcriptional regulator
MYTPSHFEETRLDVLHALVQSHPLATLVTLTAQGLVANHIPLYLRQDASPWGTLVGHVARSNPVWQDFDAATSVLAIFQGQPRLVCHQARAWQGGAHLELRRGACQRAIAGA